MKHTAHGLAVAMIGLLAARAVVAADEPKLDAYAASTDIPAHISLLKKSDKAGREQPISNGYRPQLVFSAMKTDVSCGIKLAPPKEQLLPGESADVLINCIEAFKSLADKPEFVVLEAGRKVGEGSLRP